jgi:hypothetical protein
MNELIAAGHGYSSSVASFAMLGLACYFYYCGGE